MLATSRAARTPAPRAKAGSRYVELFLPCPECATLIEVEVSISGGVVELLRHDLCPNELGPDGHRLNSAAGVQAAARRRAGSDAGFGAGFGG